LLTVGTIVTARGAPAVPLVDRRRALVAGVLAATLVLGFAGAASVSCASRSPGGGAAQRDPVQRFADALERGLDANYTAEYAADGALVTAVQAPPRRAYRGMDTIYVLAPDSAYLCRAAHAAMRCDRAPGADDLPLSHAKAISTTFTGGFVTPEYAVAILSSAAATPGARTAAAQQTVGGVPADCVAVASGRAKSDTACVSTGGVLVYFDGTTDAGTQVRVELRRITPTVAPDAFDLPAGAKIADVTLFGPGESLQDPP
jgi:hypothetical protein